MVQVINVHMFTLLQYFQNLIKGLGFCHENTWTCFGEDEGIGKLMRTLHARKASAPPGSYTKRLFEDAKLLESKVLEEAHELVEAKTKEHITAEATDVM